LGEEPGRRAHVLEADMAQTKRSDFVENSERILDGPILVRQHENEVHGRLHLRAGGN